MPLRLGVAPADSSIVTRHAFALRAGVSGRVPVRPRHRTARQSSRPAARLATGHRCADPDRRVAAAADARVDPRGAHRRGDAPAGRTLSAVERRAVAEFLAGRPVGAAPTTERRPLRDDPAVRCLAGAVVERLGPRRRTRGSSRQPRPVSAEQVPKLKLKWAFGFPGASRRARSRPSPAAACSSAARTARSTRSTRRAAAPSGRSRRRAACARPSCSARRPAACAAHRVTSATAGRTSTRSTRRPATQLWTQQVETHPLRARHRRADAAPEPPLRPGLVGRGRAGRQRRATSAARSAAASSRSTPRPAPLVWKTYTIADEPQPIGKNRGGHDAVGPVRRRHLVVADGRCRNAASSTSPPATCTPSRSRQPATRSSRSTSTTGQIAWTAQVTPKDVFVVGCNSPMRPTASDDTRTGLRLRQLADARARVGGRDLIVIGQKSGVGWALDPDKQGAVVWQYRAGKGSALGGIECGSAVDRGERLLPGGRRQRRPRGRAARGAA